MGFLGEQVGLRAPHMSLCFIASYIVHCLSLQLPYLFMKTSQNFNYDPRLVRCWEHQTRRIQASMPLDLRQSFSRKEIMDPDSTSTRIQMHMRITQTQTQTHKHIHTYTHACIRIHAYTHTVSQPRVTLALAPKARLLLGLRRIADGLAGALLALYAYTCISLSLRISLSLYHIYIYIYVCMYIYIQREREREILVNFVC